MTVFGPPYFFFGTLTDAEVLSVVIGRAAMELRAAPARLDGYRRLRVKGESYPTLRPAPKGASVEGLVIWDLTPAEISRIIFYEGEEYRVREQTVTLADGTAQKVQVFFDDLGLETEGEWDLTQWRATEQPALVRATRAFMSHFGTIADAAVSDRRWREARARAWREVSR